MACRDLRSRSKAADAALVCLSVTLALGAGCRREGQQGALQWQDVLVGIPAYRVEVAGGRVWAVLRGRSDLRRSAVVTTPAGRVEWDLIGAIEPRCLAAVSDGAWLGSRKVPPTITFYDEARRAVRVLPPARYVDVRGFDRVSAVKLLKPRRYIEGLAANDSYLWAWFMGGTVMVTELRGEVDWQPHRYAPQFLARDPHTFFDPGKGWAWHEWLICTAAPDSGWPVRICVLSATDAAHGRRLQPPDELAGYTIRCVTVNENRVWLMGENEGRVEGFDGPRWALMTIGLPDFVWRAETLPGAFREWERRPGERSWLAIAVEGSDLVIGTGLGSHGSGDLVLVQLEAGRVIPLCREMPATVEVYDLALSEGVLWVAHDHGLSRLDLHGSEPRTGSRTTAKAQSTTTLP